MYLYHQVPCSIESAQQEYTHLTRTLRRKNSFKWAFLLTAMAAVDGVFAFLLEEPEIALYGIASGIFGIFFWILGSLHLGWFPKEATFELERIEFLESFIFEEEELRIQAEWEACLRESAPSDVLSSKV